jgi:2-hydroxy-3-oxopropionate reductase
MTSPYQTAPAETTVAVIGLGIMGGPMAANLVAAGYDVVGYNRTTAKIDALVESGGRGASSVADAVKDADVIVTMVPDSPDVEGVALGDDGLIANAKSGAVWVDCSSIRPDVAVSLAERAEQAGVRAVDAPVSGGEQGAIEATLSIMVGGDPDAVATVRPVLETVGKTVVHVGPSGSGQTVKAANQLIVAGTIELVAEALIFLEAYGVDTAAAIEVLAGGLAGNRILDRKATSMVARQFTPGFRVDLHHKDMGIILAAAREAGVAIPLGAHTAQLMQSLRQLGHGDLDHSALLLLVEQLSGRGPAAPPAAGAAGDDTSKNTPDNDHREN